MKLDLEKEILQVWQMLRGSSGDILARITEESNTKHLLEGHVDELKHIREYARVAFARIKIRYGSKGPIIENDWGVRNEILLN